jgi:hypothetical protein
MTLKGRVSWDFDFRLFHERGPPNLLHAFFTAFEFDIKFCLIFVAICTGCSVPHPSYRRVAFPRIILYAESNFSPQIIEIGSIEE